MDHVAIMRKSWELTEKILDGRKTIESRWHSSRCVPWDRVQQGDTVYFKNSGEPVTLRAEVTKVAQYADLTSRRVKEILREHGKADGIEQKAIPDFFARFKDKKYCILVFLAHPRKVAPFEIDKKGFGAMAAWIAVDRVAKIRRQRMIKR